MLFGYLIYYIPSSVMQELSEINGICKRVEYLHSVKLILSSILGNDKSAADIHAPQLRISKTWYVA